MLGFQKFSFNLSVCCLQWNATLEYYFIHFYGQSLSNSKAAATTRTRTAKNPRRKNLRYISSNLFPYLSDEVTWVETFLTVHSSLIINNTRNNICLFTIDNIIVLFLMPQAFTTFPFALSTPIRGIWRSHSWKIHSTKRAWLVHSVKKNNMVGMKPTDVAPTATVKFFGAGTAGCIADLVTFPLDTAKVRLQVRTGLISHEWLTTRWISETKKTMINTRHPNRSCYGLTSHHVSMLFPDPGRV